MKYISIIAITFFVYLNSSVCYSQNISNLTLKLFSHLLENESCYSFSNFLETKYSISLKESSHISRTKGIKTSCLKQFYRTKSAYKIDRDLKVKALKNVTDNYYELFLFKRDHNNYRLIGKFSNAYRYVNPLVKLYRFPDETIYSVDGETGNDDVDWIFYRLNNNTLQEIYSIKKKGAIIGWGGTFNRTYNAKMSKKYLKKNRLKIDYKINYFLNIVDTEKDLKLFSVQKSLIVKHFKQSFFLDKRSPNSFTEINTIMKHDESYFCKAYKEELEDLIKSKSSEKLQWSKRMLSYCDPENIPYVKKLSYTLQVGAFNSKTNALKLIYRIRRNVPKLVDIFIPKGGDSKEDNKWKVYIGLYKNIEEENINKSILMKKFKNLQFIVRIFTNPY